MYRYDALRNQFYDTIDIIQGNLLKLSFTLTKQIGIFFIKVQDGFVLIPLDSLKKYAYRY